MSLSNTSTVPKLQGQLVTLETIKKRTDVTERRTKIVCTLGPACWHEEGLTKLLDAGMNVARLNFSHGDHEGHGAVLDRLRAVASSKKRNIAILLDTKGPEIRTGLFAPGVDKLHFTKGDMLTLTTDPSYRATDTRKLACSYAQLATSVKTSQSILIADGSLVLTVLETDQSSATVTCRVENNASIGERKNMNLPGVIVDLPTFTEKDVKDIVGFGIAKKVDFIAASFVRKASDCVNLRKLLEDNGGRGIKIISKIENQEGLENYDDILKETDAIMVARGDLGMEIPPAKVFLAQKLMIRKANLAGKPVITATQMLESMVSNPRPTRAECSDVANAVYDGTDAVMLSGETANGPYFENAINVMARTCCEAEGSRNYNFLYQSVKNSIVSTHGQLSTGESMASSAVKTALDINAKLILVLSETGKMAGYVSKFRPSVGILCATPNETSARQASGIMLGVHTIMVDSLLKSEELVEEISTELLKSGMLQENDSMVVIAGRMAGMKEQLRVVRLTPGKSYGHIVQSDHFFFESSMILKYTG